MSSHVGNNSRSMAVSAVQKPELGPDRPPFQPCREGMNRRTNDQDCAPANCKPIRARSFCANAIAFVLDRIADMPIEQTLDLDPKALRQNGSKLL